MQKRYLVAADVHWSQYSSIIRKRGNKYSVRLENLIKSLNWVETLATEFKCDGIIYAGDFFDKPQLNAEEITALKDIKFANIVHHFIIGNHESDISTLEYSSTAVFNNIYSNVYSEISELYVNDKVSMYLMPYMMNDKLPKLSDIVDKSRKSIVIAHQDLAGVKYGKFISQDGFDVNDIENSCTLFLDGHLHNNMHIGKNIILIGNLTGQNFNEDATKYDHGAYMLTVYDDGKIDVDNFINPFAFNFYHIHISKKSDLDQLSTLKPNSVVSVSCSLAMSESVDKMVKNVGNIIEYKKNLVYDSGQISGEYEEFKVYNHFEQFIEYAKAKFDNSPELLDELTLLSRGT